MAAPCQAVEIVSRECVHRDREEKCLEYAEAGIREHSVLEKTAL